MRDFARFFLALGFSLGVAECGELAPSARQANWGAACVSGRYWAYGERGDNFMHPGRACINCHSSWRRGPVFSIAGTIYSAMHEEDDCMGNGGPENARFEVEITDASGIPFYITANASGNFYTTHRFQLPLRRARVRSRDGRVREMGSPPPHGDCNACHSREGADMLGYGPAPGRITAP